MTSKDVGILERRYIYFLSLVSNFKILIFPYPYIILVSSVKGVVLIHFISRKAFVLFTIFLFVLLKNGYMSY